MKKIALFVCAALLSALTVNAQNTAVNLNAKASKDAAKMAKQYKKEGWVVAPGQLPLERQLDRSFQLMIELDENGYQKYVSGEGQSIGNNYDAAKMQALEMAKMQMVSKVQSQISTIVDNTVSNAQLSREQAESVTETVAASKTLISQNIGRVMTVVEVYRDKPRKSKEVRVVIFYNAEMALQSAKKAIRSELEKKGDKIHEQLDKALGF
ncbi:MAG: hypothetical protein U0L45_09040 [Alistipes sp.]|jgi:hypothetical protein|nr:hypothetical protein [Alistipes sp.]MEE0916629.1 hypothetical protein [Alistipes sp.]